VTLTNGAAETTKKMLNGAALTGLVERSMAIDEVRHWQPSKEVCLHAAKVTNVGTDEFALVAAHAWDTHGAGRAGLTTGWVGREGEALSAGHGRTARPRRDARRSCDQTLISGVTSPRAAPYEKKKKDR